jgi:hypothetical protein
MTALRRDAGKVAQGDSDVQRTTAERISGSSG